MCAGPSLVSCIKTCPHRYSLELQGKLRRLATIHQIERVTFFLDIVQGRLLIRRNRWWHISASQLGYLMSSGARNICLSAGCSLAGHHFQVPPPLSVFGILFHIDSLALGPSTGEPPPYKCKHTNTNRGENHTGHENSVANHWTCC